MPIMVCIKSGLGPINKKNAMKEIISLKQIFGNSAILEDFCVLIEDLQQDKREFKASVAARLDRRDLVDIKII